MVRINGQGDILIKKDNQNIQDHNAAFADSTFFKVFTFPMIEGDPTTALDEPNSIVIDETTAKKYFNSTNVVGKTLYVDNSTNLQNNRRDKRYAEAISFSFQLYSPKGQRKSFWLSNNTHCYILTSPGVTQAKAAS